MAGTSALASKPRAADTVSIHDKYLFICTCLFVLVYSSTCTCLLVLVYWFICTCLFVLVYLPTCTCLLVLVYWFICTCLLVYLYLWQVLVIAAARSLRCHLHVYDDYVNGRCKHNTTTSQSCMRPCVNVVVWSGIKLCNCKCLRSVNVIMHMHSIKQSRLLASAATCESALHHKLHWKSHKITQNYTKLHNVQSLALPCVESQLTQHNAMRVHPPHPYAQSSPWSSPSSSSSHPGCEWQGRSTSRGDPLSQRWQRGAAEEE